jgi:hypothetical protein
MVLFFVGILSYTSIAPQLVDKGVQGKIENQLPATIPTEVSWDEYHASRSRMKDIVELPNGKMRAKVFNEPVQYLDDDGQWKDIDTEIKTTQNGRSVRAAIASGRQNQELFVEETPYEATFSTSAKEDLVIKTEDGFWRNSYIGAQNTPGVVAGNKIVYEDAYKNVNIERFFNGDNVKQDIILKEKGHPSVFREKLETDLRLEINDDNSITYFKNDKEVAHTPRISLIDDRNQEYDVELNYKNNILEIKVPENKEFFYPAVIDPTYALATSDGYTGTSTNFYASSTTLFAGSFDTDGKGTYDIDRSVIRFNTSGIGSASTVTAAALYMYRNDATYGVSNTDVYRNTGAFSFSNFGTPIVGTLVPGALNTWSNTSITTSYINKTGYTWFTLRGNEAAGGYATGWASYGTAQKPYLDITYTSGPPAAPTNFTGTPLSATSIRWSWTDASSDEQGFTVHDGSHNVVCSAAANVTFCDETGLSANTSYTRHVHSFNVSGESAASANATTNTLTNVPTSPSATAASTSQINLSWTAPTGGASRYHVRYSGDGYASDIYNNTATSFNSTSLSANTSYTYRIYGVNADGVKSATYAEVARFTLTNVPTSPSTTAASTSQINLSWTAPTGGASRYHVRYSGDGYASDIYNNTSTSFNSTGLSANTSYTYRIYGVNADGVKSATYAEVSRATLATAPDVSANKSVDTWYNTAGVEFTNVAGFGSGGVQYYRYAWNQNPTHTFTGSETQWSASTLSRTMVLGNNYLHVKAYNADNIAASGSEVAYGPFRYDNEGPTGTIAINSSESTNTHLVTLNLSATDSGAGVYQMRFSNSGLPAEWSDWEAYGTTKPGWDMTNVLYGGNSTQGTKTVYVEFSDNASNTSTYSDTISWDGQNPNNPTTTTGPGNSGDWDNKLTPSFSWSGATDPEPASGIKGYWVYFGTDETADPKQETNASNLAYVNNGNNNLYTTTSYQVASTLTSGTTYYLKIRSQDNALNDGAHSYVAGTNLFVYRFDNVKPGDMDILTANPPGPSSTNSYQFTWSASSDAQSGLKQYTYIRRTAEGVDTWEDWDPENRFIAPDQTSINGIEALYTGVNTFRIKAIDFAGNESNVISTNYYYDSPAEAPTNPSGTALSSTSIRWSWTDSSDNEEGFRVKDLSGNIVCTVAVPNATSCDETGLSANTSYTRRIFAYSAVGESEPSINVTASTLTNVPTSPSATAASTSQINLSWTAPTGGASRYHVRYSGDGYASDIYNNTATSFNSTSLSANTSYTYRIYGVNADGVKSATYAEVARFTLTNVPTSPIATAASTSRIELSWSPPISGGVSSYNVRSSSDNYSTVKYNGTSPAWFEIGLNTNTAYTYRIYGVNANGAESATFASVSRATLATAPDVSANKSVDTWYNTAGVEFTNVAGFGSGGVQYYRYAWNQNPTHTFTGSETQWSASTLSRTMVLGNNYLHVKAYNADNIAASGSEVAYGPFRYDNEGPTGTIAINSSESTNTHLVTLNLSATDSGAGVYQMRFSNSGLPAEWSDWEAYGTTKPGWDMTNVLYGGNSTQGTKTVYVEFSDNASNTSTYSDTISWDGQNPNNPTTTTGPGNSGDWDNKLTPSFSWSGATDPEPASGIKGYWVYFGTDETADPKQETNASNLAYVNNGNNNLYTTTSYQVASTLTSGTTYYLKIRSQDNALNDGAHSYVAGTNLFVYRFDGSRPSDIDTLNVNPTTWTDINSFNFTWSASSDSHSGLKQYTYVRRTAEGQNQWEDWDPENRFIAPDQTSINGIEALYTGVNTFRIKAIDFAGNESNVAYVNYFYSLPVGGPTNVSVDYSQSDDRTVNFLRFYWDEVSGAQGYFYNINSIPTAENSTFTDQTSTGFRQFTGVNNGINNVFYVVTRDAAGNVGWGSPTQVSFLINTVAPDAPSNLSITDSSSRESSRWQLTIGWDAPQSLTPDFDGYIIERSTDGLIYSNLDTVSRRYDNTIPNGYLDTNLSSSTTYYYRVRSKDNTGNSSGPSAVVSRMPTGKYTSPPTYTSNPVADPKATMVTISWTTNRPSNTIVQYGLTQSYGQEVSKSTEQVTEHRIDILGLTPGETYYYRVQSLDEDRDYTPNSALSDGYQFSTSQAPGISNVSTSEIRLTSAIITWKTTSSATSRILYGTTMAYGSVYNDTSGSQTTTHTVKIDGLKDSTTYHYRIQGTDIEGNTLLSDNYVFETLTFPRLSNLTIEQVPNTPTSTVKVSFSSNVPTTSLVTFSGAGARDAAKYDLVTEHEMQVSGLSDNTSYSVAVRGRDQYGNEAVPLTTSHKTDFDTRPPVISDITVETSITGYGVDARGQIIVSWNTDEPATSQIEYGEGVAGEEYSAKTQEDAGLSQNHVVIISDLKPSAPYHFRVVSRDAAGNTGKSGDNSVLTQQASESIIDLIIKSLQSTIGWIFSAFGGGGVQ